MIWTLCARTSESTILQRFVFDALQLDDLTTAQGVPVLQDLDQDTTDLMKCIETLEEKERTEGHKVRLIHSPTAVIDLSI